MDANYRITLETQPSQADRDELVRRLTEYNRQKAGDEGYRPLAIFVRDSEGAIVGGIYGSTYWNWFAIDLFWISEELRGQGYGDRLLAAAEEEAVRRRLVRWDGCCVYYGTPETDESGPIPADDVRDIRSLVERERGTADGFEICVGGFERGPDADRERDYVRSDADRGRGLVERVGDAERPGADAGGRRAGTASDRLRAMT